MLKRTIIILILLLPQLVIGQQQYFNKRYDFNRANDIGFDILPYDTGYIAWFSTSLTSANDNYKIVVCFLDSVGNIEQTKTKSYSKPNAVLYSGGGGKICKTSDNGFALAGTIEYSSGYSNT